MFLQTFGEVGVCYVLHPYSIVQSDREFGNLVSRAIDWGRPLGVTVGAQEWTCNDEIPPDFWKVLSIAPLKVDTP